MMLRAHATRLMLLALAGVLLLGVFAGMASADEYGGLGPLGTFKAGRDGGHLESPKTITRCRIGVINSRAVFV